MNMCRYARTFLAALLGLHLAIAPVSAQVSQPDSLTPPTQEQIGASADKQRPAAPKKGPVVKAEDEEIIWIPGPKIGKAEKPVITPEMLEQLYTAVWAKIGKEYTEPHKLGEWSKWKDKYKGQIKTPEDLDKAIKEMTESLNDRWTTYTSPADIEQQKQNFKDGLLPVGMLLRPHKDGKWHIDGMMFKSAAQQSVLREGDIIKSVNGKILDGMKPADVNKMLMGKEGDKVTVVAIYENAEHTVEITIAKPGRNGIEAGILPGNIAYVRLPTFVKEEIVEQFMQTIAQIYMQNEGQVNGLIVDLRYNGGGLVTMALNLSGLFLEEGTITRTTTRQDRMVTETAYKSIGIPEYLEKQMPAPIAQFQHWLQTVPLVILTNGSTASASEITTGALQDNGRAVVIGTTSFGKAVGYTNTPMPNGGVIQVTNLSYLTPDGKNIADTGIKPNKVVEQPRGKQIQGEDDEQLKAGHEHLLQIVKTRMEQLTEARDTAVKPQVAPKVEAAPFVLHGYHVAVGILAGLVLAMLGGYAFSVLRLRIFRRRG